MRSPPRVLDHFYVLHSAAPRRAFGIIIQAIHEAFVSYSSEIESWSTRSSGSTLTGQVYVRAITTTLLTCPSFLLHPSSFILHPPLLFLS